MRFRRADVQYFSRRRSLRSQCDSSGEGELSLSVPNSKRQRDARRPLFLWLLLSQGYSDALCPLSPRSKDTSFSRAFGSLALLHCAEQHIRNCDCMCSLPQLFLPYLEARLHDVAEGVEIVKADDAPLWIAKSAFEGGPVKSLRTILLPAGQRRFVWLHILRWMQRSTFERMWAVGPYLCTSCFGNLLNPNLQ